MKFIPQFYNDPMFSHYNIWSQQLEEKKQSSPHQTPNPPKKSNRPTKRTTFTPEQVSMLEVEFAKNEYICKDRRSEVAKVIDLSECQVKTWFQNRRTKKRRYQVPSKQNVIKHTNSRSNSLPQQQPAKNECLIGWDPRRFNLFHQNIQIAKQC